MIDHDLAGSNGALFFRARLVMESDWHVGTGAGRSGHVDRLVARDHDGLPYVPAKTLTGVWRDACERLASALDGVAARGWSAWVGYLFGSQPAQAKGPVEAPPLAAVLSVRSAHLVEPLRRALGPPASAELREALTFVKPGVSIDEETGQAREQFLRFEEMSRAGAVLEAECSLRVPSDPTARSTALALLAGGAALVERLGGKRRRGGGRCRLELDGVLDLSAARAWLDEHEEAPPVPVDTSAHPSVPPAPASTPPDDWVELALVIHLRSPLSVPSRVIGNVGETLDFLPGHMLLPLLSHIAREREIDLGPAVGAGDVVVLPATLEIDGARGRPVPFSLAVPKGSGFVGGEVTNLFAQQDVRPLKQLRAGYLGPAPAEHARLPRRVVVPLIVRTHNSVDDDQQRPNEATGGVYSYEAIAAGTRLRTVIRLRRAVHELLAARDPQWWEALTGPWALGRSKKDDYGQVVMEVGGPPGSPQVTVPAHASGPGGTLVVWCLSDMLLRDSALRPATSADALAGALGGVQLEPDRERVQFRVRRLDSWHVRWGLPRPSLVAIAAGSCAVLTVWTGHLEPEALRRVALAGLGERRAEGHGQLSFDDPLVTGSLAGWSSPLEGVAGETATESVPIDANGEVGEFARLVEREAWRSLLRRRVLSLAANPQFRTTAFGWPATGGRPPASQLNALREAVRRAGGASGESYTARWLAQLQHVKNRSDKWPPGALDRARSLVVNPGAVWLLLMEEAPWPTLTRGDAERLRSELWADAVQALVDEAARQHLRAREPQASAGEEGS